MNNLSVIDIISNKNSKIHFIGIGGVSMSSLAKLLLNDGLKISGSDSAINNNVTILKNLGVKIYDRHSKNNISEYDLVVYTAAISADNEELLEAIAKDILVIERSVLLGEMMKGYKCPINIAGTHGKTTTTSMVSSIFLAADLDPTISVGGDFNKIGGNLHIGGKDFFICEACEYVESFLKFYPYASIILNIEADHLDYFKDIDHIKSSFVKFINRTNVDGFAILNGEDKNCLDIKDKLDVPVYTFGLHDNNTVYAKDITYDKFGCPSYDLHYKDYKLGRITLHVPGIHNVLNSLAAALCGIIFDVGFNAIKEGLCDFNGAKRRFEYKGEYNGAKIYDDYAHHPTEIKTTIDSALKREYNKLHLIFQPHTYTRTMALMDDFEACLKDVDGLIIADIYAAREKNICGISSKDLADKLPKSTYIGSLNEIYDYLKQRIEPDDLVITVGAGDIYKVGEMLLKS